MAETVDGREAIRVERVAMAKVALLPGKQWIRADGIDNRLFVNGCFLGAALGRTLCDLPGR